MLITTKKVGLEEIVLGLLGEGGKQMKIALSQRETI